MNTAPLIVLIDDEPQMRRFLRAALVPSYRLVEAATAAEGLTLAASENPSLILLDLGLPDGDGLTLVARIREWSQVPILVISARGREADKVEALDAGADDYITKPFGMGELLARIRVALRRQTAPSEPILRLGPWEIDFARRRIAQDSGEIHLTPIEWRLLTLLAKNAGKVVTHGQILREVWGPRSTEHTHYLRVYLAQLRRKLEPDASRPRWLLTEPGVGYRLRPDES